jgi:hypothetical protein
MNTLEIKTAEEFLKGFTTGKSEETPQEYVVAAMVEFAKMHREKIIEEALKKVRMKEDRSHWSGQPWDDGPLPLIIDRGSILNCYPEELIK